MEKTKQIHIRLTPEEYDRLIKAAADSKISTSEYLRLGIGGYREPHKTPEELKKLIYDLNKIGVNLNQLVVIARTKHYDTKQIESCLNELNETRELIQKVILNY